MKLFAVTVPAAALLGYAITLAWDDLRPFVVAAIVLPLLSVSLTAAVLASWRVARWMPVTEPAVQAPMQTVQTVLPRVSAYDMTAPAMPARDYTEEWRAQIIRFALVGNDVGFPWLRMRPYVGRAGWDTYTDIMAEMGALTTYPRTQWVAGYGQGDRPVRYFARHVLASRWVPPSPDKPAPAVTWISRP